MTYYQNLDNILDNVSYVFDFTNNFFILREARKEKETEQDTSFLIPTLTLNTAVVPFKFLSIPTPYYSP